MMDQALIDLLNDNDEFDENYMWGIKKESAASPGYNGNDVFIKNGEPTDAFLEALRRDLDNDFGEYDDSVNEFKKKPSKTKKSSQVVDVPISNVKVAKNKKTSNKNSRNIVVEVDHPAEGKDKKRSTKPRQNQEAPTQEIEEGKSPAEANYAQAALRSLQLRLVGSMGAIKELQTQLKVAHNQIDDDRKTIQKLQAKLKHAMERVSSARPDPGDNHTEFLLREIDELKKKLSVTEVRLDEECAERIRWEERSRNWRQCAEQAKQKLQILDAPHNKTAQSSVDTDKSEKSQRRMIVKLEAENANLKGQMQAYKLKFEREELKIEDYMIRTAKASNQIEELQAITRRYDLEIQRLQRIVEEKDLQLEVMYKKQKISQTTDKLMHKAVTPSRPTYSSRSDNAEKAPISTNTSEYDSRHYDDNSKFNSNTSNSSTSSRQQFSQPRSVPIKFLSSAATSKSFDASRQQSSSPSSKILPPAPPTTTVVSQQATLHSDTVAMIKSIAAKTVQSVGLPATSDAPDAYRSKALDDVPSSVTTQTVGLNKLYEKIRSMA